MTNSIDKLLREALAARAAASPPTPCPDAAIIAALAERTLPARERSGAEAHVADCARCQAVLAALARTMPPAAARVWWRRPAFVWVAPLTAAAAALIIWTAVPRREIVAPAAQLESERARATAPSGAGLVKPPEATEQRAERETAPAAAPAAPAISAQQERGRIANRQRVPERPQQKAFADSPVAERAAPAPPAATEARIAAAPPPSTPTPPAAPAPPPPPAASAEASASRALAAEAQRRASAGTLAVTSDSAGQVLARRLEGRDTTIVSANSSNRWRLGSRAGFVQRSTDSGATWQVLATGVNATLVDGSSPSQSVCWLVGRAGVVVVTTDSGRTWQRLTFPVSIDLRSVSATDDKTATVVAADGRTFTTSDGGATWRP
jgi:hypothetical protein